MGGWITDHWGWRWVFYINLPVAGIALLAVLYALPTVKTDHQVKLDWQGSLALVAGLVPLLLAFTWAGHEYAWFEEGNSGLLKIKGYVLGIRALGRSTEWKRR